MNTRIFDGFDITGLKIKAAGSKIESAATSTFCVCLFYPYYLPNPVILKNHIKKMRRKDQWENALIYVKYLKVPTSGVWV